MATRHFTAAEALALLQDIDSEESGKESELTDEDTSDVDLGEEDANEDRNQGHVIESTSSESSDLSDADIPLKYRINAPSNLLRGHPASGRAGRSMRGRSSRGYRGRGRVVKRPMIAHTFSSSSSSSEVEDDAPIQPGKDGTQWENLHVVDSQICTLICNIIHVAPGLTGHSKSSINSILDAFRHIIDICMVSWIANYTHLEATR